MFQISYGLLQFDYFVCPIDYDEVKGALSMECERSFAFRLHEYSVPWFIHGIGALVGSSVINNCYLQCPMVYTRHRSTGRVVDSETSSGDGGWGWE